MSIPCEVAVKCVLPSVRAMMAKALTTKHRLKQEEAAKLLGISQPAISLYHRKMRGVSIDLENDSDIIRLTEKLADSMVENELSRKEFILKFCEICKTIRAKGLLCRMHKAFDPTINVKECGLCLTNEPPLACT